jgi:hypothetical protein
MMKYWSEYRLTIKVLLLLPSVTRNSSQSARGDIEQAVSAKIARFTFANSQNCS